MDVINAEQAKIAEAAGACAVMALERSVRQSLFETEMKADSMMAQSTLRDPKARWCCQNERVGYITCTDQVSC